MKKSLSLFLVYIVVFLIMSCVAAYLHMQEIQTTLLVAGKILPFIDLKLFAKGLLIYFPICSALSLLPFSFYLIRHKYKVPQYLIPYIIICLVVFFGIFPLGMTIQKNIPLLTESSNNIAYTPLSPGYFRNTEDTIVYYISTNQDGSSKVLHIQKPTKTKVLPTITKRNFFITSQNNTHFSDPLIHDVFGTDNNHIGKLKDAMLSLYQRMINSFEAGFLQYFLFLSIGFALSSVIGLRRFAKWRLLNLFNMCLAYFGIILINIILYSNRFYEILKTLEPYRNWLPIVVNYFIFVFYLTLGIFSACKIIDPNRESD